MGKKVREYKSGDFIFAKVKGYPAWPARVQRLNGKKYYVYFYGTGETANLPSNMIFDYAENKDKFLAKMVKRRDFRDGVKQIEHDFANNVPLEQVIGVAAEEPMDTTGNDTLNDSGANDTLDDTAADTTAADETMAEDTTVNASTNDTAVEDSDDTGTLVIDEGKQKGRKGKVEAKAKETPVKPAKEPKTPRGKAKKEEPAKEDDEEAKQEEEIISRSGRKIRPKRYIDEHTEDNTTLPSPAPKKRRGASPAPEKEKTAEPKEKVPDKNIKQFNAVTQSELEDLKEPFKPQDAEKENILITYLPSGQYVGIKLFQSRPSSFKNESSRLQWDKQAASNAVTLKMQLEKGQITSNSVIAQLVTDLNLTDEEKATLDKERETEEKKSRVQFLKTEMKLIELDAKIKTCLCLEKADTDMCLKLLDELIELDVKPLMLLKHPTCLETIKRMRAYVGNTPSWELSESAAHVFNKQAHKIRKQADLMYKSLKELFITPEGLSFWEYFTERVLQFKKVTAKLTADELLEMIHEPLEMSTPTSHSMKAAVEAANEDEQKPEDEQEETPQKKKSTPAKTKKGVNNTTPKQTLKRQSSRKLQQEEKEKETQKDKEKETQKDKEKDTPKDKETPKDDPPKSDQAENSEDVESSKPENETSDTPQEESSEKTVESTEVLEKEVENSSEEKKDDSKDGNGKEAERVTAQNDKSEKEVEKNDKSDKESDKEKEEKQDVEPRAKRSRESKKTEPPPTRSPAKRKSKF